MAVPIMQRCMHACMLSCFSRVQLCVTVWTVAHQAPLSMGFSRQEYWSGQQCPSPGDLPDRGIEPMSLMSPELADRFFTTSATWEAQICKEIYNCKCPFASFGISLKKKQTRVVLGCCLWHRQGEISKS